MNIRWSKILAEGAPLLQNDKTDEVSVSLNKSFSSRWYIPHETILPPKFSWSPMARVKPVLGISCYSLSRLEQQRGAIHQHQKPVLRGGVHCSGGQSEEIQADNKKLGHVQKQPTNPSKSAQLFKTQRKCKTSFVHREQRSTLGTGSLSIPPPPLDGCPVRGTKHGTTKEELESRNIQEVAQEGGI